MASSRRLMPNQSDASAAAPPLGVQCPATPTWGANQTVACSSLNVNLGPTYPNRAWVPSSGTQNRCPDARMETCSALSMAGLSAWTTDSTWNGARVSASAADVRTIRTRKDRERLRIMGFSLERGESRASPILF